MIGMALEMIKQNRMIPAQTVQVMIGATLGSHPFHHHKTMCHQQQIPQMMIGATLGNPVQHKKHHLSLHLTLSLHLL